MIQGGISIGFTESYFTFTGTTAGKHLTRQQFWKNSKTCPLIKNQ
jgi:hypothetical protein